jgi:Domain of unknown function (DUF4352)
MREAVRRVIQVAIALALAGASILVTEWAYPAGSLAIQVGRPYYSRDVGENAVFVTIDLTIKNVGAEPVRVDSEHFLLVDDAGHRYPTDPSMHLLRNHFNWLTMPAGYELHAVAVFKSAVGHRAAGMIYITPTGQFVWFRLP